jgi:type IV pilus assembly protein PilB
VYTKTVPKIKFGLIRTLITRGLINETDTSELIKQAKKKKISVLRYILNQQLVDSTSITMTAVEEFGLSYLDLDAIDALQLPLTELTNSLIRKHQILPLFKAQ